MNEQYVVLVCVGIVLTIATITDIKSHRITNSLTGSALVFGLLLNSWTGGTTGFISGFSGLLIGLLCFLPFYIAGGMAAGDVKLMAAVGSFIGTPLILHAVLMSLIAGSILGILWLIRFNGIGSFIRRYWLIGKYSLMTGSFHYLQPENDEAALLRFPYATAISCGTLAALWL